MSMSTLTKPHEHLEAFMEAVSETTKPTSSPPSIYNSFARSPSRTSQRRASTLKKLRVLNNRDALFTAWITFLMGENYWNNSSISSNANANDNLNNPVEGLERFMGAMNSITHINLADDHDYDYDYDANCRPFWNTIKVEEFEMIQTLEDLCGLPNALFALVKKSTRNTNTEMQFQVAQKPRKRFRVFSASASNASASASSNASASSSASNDIPSWKRVYAILGYILSHALVNDASIASFLSGGGVPLQVGEHSNSASASTCMSISIKWEVLVSFLEKTLQESGFISGNVARNMHSFEYDSFQVGVFMYVLDCMHFSTGVRKDMDGDMHGEELDAMVKRRCFCPSTSMDQNIEIELSVEVEAIIQCLTRGW